MPESRIRRLKSFIRMKLQGPESVRKYTAKEVGGLLLEYAKTYPANIAVAIVMAVWTQAELFGFGSLEWAALQTGNDSVSSFVCCLILAFVFLRLTHSAKWRWLLSGLAVVLGFLLPLFLMTDAALVSAQNLDTLLESDVKEGAEFLSAIPTEDWVFSIGAGILAALSVCLTHPFKPSEFHPDETKFYRQWKLFAIVCLLIIPAASPINDIGRGFYVMTKLRYTTPETTWHVTGCCIKHPKADNYVIFMSEALSEKVMGLYGAPFDTTPFLSSVPSKRIETFVSASHATAAAVSFFSAMENPKDITHPSYENNIINIAKEAGLKTYWVSSQGKTSAFEAPISYIASQTDQQYFVKKHDDFAVIPAVKEILASSTPGPKGRLIFIHTYGAHERTCDRVADFGKPFKTGAEDFIDCYLASAAKADKVVESVVKTIKASGQTYSLIFTSDHAINWRRDKGELKALRNSTYQGQYSVPFVQIGEGVIGTTVSKVQRASVRFLDYFPTWIGVLTNKTPPAYDVFNDDSDEAEIIKPDGKKTKFSSLKRTPTAAEILLR